MKKRLLSTLCAFLCMVMVFAALPMKAEAVLWQDTTFEIILTVGSVSSSTTTDYYLYNKNINISITENAAKKTLGDLRSEAVTYLNNKLDISATNSEVEITELYATEGITTHNNDALKSFAADKKYDVTITSCLKKIDSSYDGHIVIKYKFICPHESSEKVSGAAPTCKDAGYIDAYKCTMCKCYFTDSALTNEIGKADAYDAWKTTGDGKINKLDYHPEASMHTQTRVDPDCTTDGCKEYCWCDVCGTYAESYTAAESKATLGTVIGDSTALAAWKASSTKGLLTKLGHDWSAWTEYDEAQHSRVCSRDPSHVEYADHEWGDWALTRRGDEGTEGEYSRTCSDCTAVSHKYFQYTILEGDGGVYTRGQSKSGKTIEVRASGDADLCSEILVNGKTLDPANYTKTSGSTIITLDAAKYLDKLSARTYKLTFVYPDGSVTALFKVRVPKSDPKDPQPPTGYDENLIIWINIVVFSGLILAWSLVWLKKRGLLSSAKAGQTKED